MLLCFFFAKTTHDFLQIYTRKKTQNFPTRLELTEKMQMERFKKQNKTTKHFERESSEESHVNKNDGVR